VAKEKRRKKKKEISAVKYNTSGHYHGRGITSENVSSFYQLSPKRSTKTDYVVCTIVPVIKILSHPRVARSKSPEAEICSGAGCQLIL